MELYNEDDAFFLLVFVLELRVKDFVRTICDARLICSEINL